MTKDKDLSKHGLMGKYGSKNGCKGPSMLIDPNKNSVELIEDNRPLNEILKYNGDWPNASQYGNDVLWDTGRGKTWKFDEFPIPGMMLITGPAVFDANNLSSTYLEGITMSVDDVKSLVDFG